jgi:hypothetical protein
VIKFASSLGQGVDQLQGNARITGGALDNLTAGASQQAALTKASENMRSKLNKMLADTGEAPVDFDQQDQAVAKALRQQTLASLQESGADMSKIMQDPGLAVVSKLTTDEPSIDDELFNLRPGSKSSSYQALSGNIRDLPRVNLSLGEDNTNKFELPETSTIADKQGPSLWKVISRRYLQNFDQFFERLIPAAATKTPATAPAPKKK